MQRAFPRARLSVWCEERTMYQLQHDAGDVPAWLSELEQMRVIGYIRVSTEEQRDNNSFQEQAKCIEKWCGKKSHLLDSIYFDAESGAKLTERPGLRAAI